MSDPEQRVELNRKELEQLFQSANNGDREAHASLIAWMDQNPEVWQEVGDAGARTELVLRRELAQGDVFQGECLRRDAAAMRDSLLTLGVTPLETVVIQAVVVSWLGLNLAQQRLATEGRNRKPFERAAASAQRLFANAVRDLLSLQKVLGRADCADKIGNIIRSAMSTGLQCNSGSNPDILRFDRDAVAKPNGHRPAAHGVRN